MKGLYIAAWFLLAVAIAATAYASSFSSVSIVAFSVVGLVLIYALALWSVFTDPSEFTGK